MDQRRPLTGGALDAAADACAAVAPAAVRQPFRVRGSASEAEDVAQDRWVRWPGADRSTVRHRGAFLA